MRSPSQWDLFETSDGRSRVIIIQNDLIESFNTRLVVPVILQSDAPGMDPHLIPVVMEGDDRWVAFPLHTGTVAVSELGRHLGNLEGARDGITRALDRIMSGV